MKGWMNPHLAKTTIYLKGTAGASSRHPVCHSPHHSYCVPSTDIICYWSCSPYTSPLFHHWCSCLFYIGIFIYDMMLLVQNVFGKKKKKKKSLLLKIIWKLLDKRTFQIPSSSNNQWIHASQPFRSISMKYKTSVFNFPSSPPLNTFFPFFEPIPAGADHVSPLREQFLPTCRLEPANNLSFTTPFLIMYSHSNPEWQDLQRQLLGSRNIWRRGKCEVGCSILLLLFFTERKQLRSSHGRWSKQKLWCPAPFSSQHSNVFSPPPMSTSSQPHPQAQFSTARREAGSLRALFAWPYAAQDVQFTPIKGGRFKSPDWVSIPLLVIAQSIFKFQQPLCESGKQAVLISERQAFLGSAAGVSASGLMLNWLMGQ